MWCEMKKVSIIMPVYNSEKYLNKAIESVLAQDFQDFELILVDDGSADNSAKICDRYSQLYDNVLSVHKENGGICSARNAGLEVAKGEYIGFCDNDDTYMPHLLRDNYELAKNNDVDLMRYAKLKKVEKDDGRVREIHAQILDMFIEKKEFYKYYQNIRKEDTVWTGLYRRKIIEDNDIRFDERFKFGSEDLNFNLRFLMHCNRLGFNSKEYYSWTQRESHSTSRKFKRDYLEKYMINIDLENKFMTEICDGKVDNVMKNIFLINVYVYPLIEYMTLKSCDMTMKEKVLFLERLRKKPIFDRKILKSTLQKVRKRNIRVYITMFLFYRGRYKTLLWLLTYGIDLMDKLRFKSK